MNKKNTNCLDGMKCPCCGGQGLFRLVAAGWTLVHNDGTDSAGDLGWTDGSPLRCVGCGYSGKVGDCKVGSKAYRLIRKRAKLGPDPRYICHSCADKRGGKWPEGHCATQHAWFCAHCKQFAGLCAVDDWEWPRGSRRPKGPGGGRD